MPWSILAPRQKSVAVDWTNRRGLLAAAWHHLLPPRSLQARIRWFFLIAALLNALVLLPLLAADTSRPMLTRLVGGLASVGVTAIWLRGYRRGTFGWRTHILEAGLVVGSAVGAGGPMRVIGVFYVGILFGSLYGGWRNSFILLVTQLGALATSFAITGFPPESTTQFLNHLVGFLTLGTIMALQNRTLTLHERASAREQILTRTGGALAAATSRGEICETLARAATNVVESERATYVWLAMSGSAGQTEVITATDKADSAADPHLDLGALPPAARAALEDGRQVLLRDAEVGLFRDTFGLRRTTHALAITPLNHRGQWLGALVIEGAQLVPPECRGPLETLASGATLALQTTALTQDLSHQATHDGLTGLPNRVLFMDRLGHAVERQGGTCEPISVLFLDLDGFKPINDTLGHAAGDALLVQVAGRIQGTVRASDTAARVGGDEFAVLLEGAANQVQAEILAERLLGALHAPFGLPEGPISIGVSIGIAVSQSPSRDSESLLREADTAMYVAKRQGKGWYAVFEPSTPAALLEPPDRASRKDTRAA